MEGARAILIYFVVPALGCWLYWELRERMHRSGIANPPSLPVFLVFVSYGGWLVVLLTELFWYWSGMASLGVAYLVFVAPVVMLVLAYRLSLQRQLSKFHHRAFIASAWYFVLPVGVLLFALLFGR